MKKNIFAFFLGTLLIVSSCFPVKAETSFLSENSEIVQEENVSNNAEQDNTESINQKKENVESNNQEEINISEKEEEVNTSKEENQNNTIEIIEKENTSTENQNNILEVKEEINQDNIIEKEEINISNETKEENQNDVIEEKNIQTEEIKDNITETTIIEESNNNENIIESVETNTSSDFLETINNEDGSRVITYEEVISNIKEEEVETVVQDKTIEQEEIKESIEDQNGTYNYNIAVNEEQKITEVIVPAEQKEDAESLAADLGGEVLTEEQIIIQETSETFNSLEEAQNFITNIEDNHTIIESTITVTPEQIISGVTVEQIEENGYHCIRNEDGSYDIIVTGGLEQITIDLAYLSAILEPGDSVSAEIHIKNESGDEYEIESYNKEVEGPFRYIRTVNYNESMGEAVGTLMGGAYTYYIPNDIVKMHGKTHLATPSDEVVKWYNEKNNTRLSYSEIRSIITDDILLEYYNEVLNKEYDSLYEAWVDNFNDRLWQTKYNGQKGEEFFETLEWENNEFSFVVNAGVDGPGTDNMYQNSVWGYIEQIILKVVDTIIPATYEASVTYEDVEYQYSVKYNEIEKDYVIEIKGEGNIPPVEIIIPPSEKEDPPIEIVVPPKKEPTPSIPELNPPEEKPILPSIPKKEERIHYHSSETSQPIIIIEDNIIPLANEPTIIETSEENIEEPIVLGASRQVILDSEQEVLGVKRLPQTGTVSFYFIIIFFISGIISIITGVSLLLEEN